MPEKPYYCSACEDNFAKEDMTFTTAPNGKVYGAWCKKCRKLYDRLKYIAKKRRKNDRRVYQTCQRNT